MPQSLECPRCNGAVSVADDVAGKRVKCPHCEQTFLAPGFASTSNDDDDDWLKLDEDPVVPAVAKTPPPQKTPRPKATPPPAKATPPATTPSVAPNAPKASTPSLSADDEALLAEFTSDLDDFTAEIETPPAPLVSAPAGPAPSKPAAPFRGIAPAAGVGSPASAKPSPKPAADVEYATEYRVTCNICGSLLYAKAAQAGKIVKCSDCHSPITIPPPPKVRKKQEIKIDEAETFALDPGATVERGPDPYKKSADELLEEASREEETSVTPRYDDTPSVKDWLMNVFGIFKDLGVLMHWVGLAVFASIPAVIALALDSPILIMGLFPAGFFLGVLTVSCGFAILNSVANEEESVTEWPTLDPMAWLGQLFVAVAAASLAAIPIWALCQVILGSSLVGVAATMFSVYILFPFVLLSMLDMNTPLLPFSPEVARSVTKCEEAWGGFYFSSGMLFLALFMTFLITSSTMSPPAAAVVAIVTGIGGTFVYFSMIGRLAYSIGQVINAPPMKNDIDRTRKTDAI